MAVNFFSKLFADIANMSMLNLGFLKLEQPEWLFLIIPLIVLATVLTSLNFVKFEKEVRNKLWQIRLFVIICRFFIIFLLCVALANPFITKKVTTQGDTTITLLVDNSTSTSIFNLNIGELEARLEEHLPVTKAYIGYEESSHLGDGIFRQLHRKNLLLVTDANNDKDSMSFYDVAAYAKKFNTSINAVKLEDVQPEVSINIVGPKTGIVDTEYYYTILLRNALEPVSLRVTVDGRVAYDGETQDATIPLSNKFTSVGSHKITTEVMINDRFSNNNKYYKVVDIVDKPKILYMSNKESSIANLLPVRYSTTATATMPTNLDEYFAMILNDNSHTITLEEEKTLETYTDDGNGLIVWGGSASFNGPSNIDILLPVKPGEPTESNGAFNFIFLVDMSGVVDNALMETEQYALEVIELLKNRKETINIAVVDFSYMAHIVSEFKPVAQAGETKNDLINFKDVSKIDGTYWLRPADLASGLKLARDVYTSKSGNNNIIVVTDGNINYEKYFVKAEKEIEELRNAGIRVHSVHLVSRDFDDSVLKEIRKRISSLGRGMYIVSALQINDLFEKKLIVSDHDHFISNDLPLNAVISNYNKVVPTPAARTLITTGTGAPVVTVNNYNKVAAISTDDGTNWAGNMLQGQNLALFYRIMDWAIGDPNRKKLEYVYVEDTTVGKETTVKYKGTAAPSSDRCNFLEIEDHYECTVMSQQQGFDEILNVPFAVNYDDEYAEIGFNEAQLRYLTKETAGLIFPAENVEEIVQKVKSDAKVDVIQRIKLDWIIVCIAIMVYLIEILVRRIIINKGTLRP